MQPRFARQSPTPGPAIARGTPVPDPATFIYSSPSLPPSFVRYPFLLSPLTPPPLIVPERVRFTALHCDPHMPESSIGSKHAPRHSWLAELPSTSVSDTP
ncbi:hypothetical protein B0H14DRAFT_3464257 [Mycena olivaceomarginata]|nr:hypothetical protein B0H14DRAFT_3464257 [Mycena olivaceomarginata]